MSKQEIINRLLRIETWAEGLREECHKTRKMMEAGVSTSATNHDSKKAISKAVVERKQKMLKPKLKIA